MTSVIKTEQGVSPDNNFDVIIVGAGFAGMYMLHKLRQLGLRHWVLQPCEDKRAPGSAQAARQALEQGVAQAWPGLAVATLRG